MDKNNTHAITNQSLCRKKIETVFLQIFLKKRILS